MERFLDIVRHYQHFGLLAFMVAVFATPLAMRVAHRYGILDIPDQTLKPHARPIPYLGGAAICLAWAVTLLVAVLTGTCASTRLVPYLLGGVGMSLLGLADDIRPVPPRTRLLIGTLIITAVLLATGTGFRLVDSVAGGLAMWAAEHGLTFPDWWYASLRTLALPLSVFISIFVVLGACNSANLLDGLDGLCSGVTAIISLGFFLLASHLAIWNYSDQGDPVRLVLSIAMLGAALGFLPWNFNPARIFMGDAGSVLLGYNCGILILLFAERGIFRWVIGALMIFALPVFDTALAMFRRWRAGRSIFEGDRSHFYDQLVQRGLSVRRTVLVCYGLTIVYAGIGLLLTWVDQNGPVIRTRHAVFLYLAVVIVTAVLAKATGLTRPEESQATRPRPPDRPAPR